ncbi:MAG TPA: PrsW family glutamic-type intramembrane protease [Kofleriaceae bacterium]
MLFGSKFVLIAGLVGFVLLAWLVELVAGFDGSVHVGPIVTALMASIPAALWLGFFYLMDRHDPEPKHLVIGVCVVGALIAAPLADLVQFGVVAPLPLEQHSFPTASLIGMFLQPDRVVYAMLVAGLAQEMCKYAAVRYTIYNAPAFDEPMDGIVYMMACGTGFAVWVNYHRMAAQGHRVDLSIAAAQSVVTVLAHASFAGALGYIMGRAKFSRRSAPLRGLFIMLGLLGAAALNGAFAIVETWINSNAAGTRLAPWKGVGYAAGFATLVFAGVLFASERLLDDSPFKREDT